MLRNGCCGMWGGNDKKLKEIYAKDNTYILKKIIIIKYKGINIITCNSKLLPFLSKQTSLFSMPKFKP